MAKAINPPSDQWITQPAAYTHLSARQLKSAQTAGLLPAPLKLGIKLRAWKKSDLDRLMTGEVSPSTATAQTV